MESRYALVDGIRMRWVERGKGTPVVLLHGIPTSPALWRHVLPLVEAGRCLAWEMVGYGDSIVEGRGRNLSVAAQATYLGAWLKKLGINRPVLVGHDLGGGVAQVAAVREPRRFAGLVLTNSIAYDSWPIPSVRALRASAPILERLPSAALKPIFASFMVRGHDRIARARDALALHSAAYEGPGGAAALADQVRSLDVRDTVQVAPRLRGLRLHTSVVWGAVDRFQKIEYGERLARDLGAKLTRIPGGKHFTPEDHPYVVANAIGDLVRQVGMGNAA